MTKLQQHGMLFISFFVINDWYQDISLIFEFSSSRSFFAIYISFYDTLYSHIDL